MVDYNLVVLDTNVLMENCENIFDELNGYELIISAATLDELDKLKTDSKRGYKARNGLRFIENNLSGLKIIPISDNVRNLKNDDIILDLAYRIGALCTSDRIMKIKAQKIYNIPVIEYINKNNGMYKGYKELTGNIEYINNLFNNADELGLVQNEYLIMHNTDLGNVSEYRYDNGKLINIKLPPSRIVKGLNPLQRCALDLLGNKDIPIKILQGTFGSGKTYLAVKTALYNTIDKSVFNKILVVREVVGEGKEIGFLPGGLDDKTKDFFKPIEQSLDGGEFELKSLDQRGVLEKTIPYYIKGTTYNDTIMLVDESSDLSYKQLKTIGARVGQNSNVVFMGDHKQSVYDDSLDNALIRLCNNLKGNKLFGTITLNEDVRSEASKAFAELD